MQKLWSLAKKLYISEHLIEMNYHFSLGMTKRKGGEGIQLVMPSTKKSIFDIYKSKDDLLMYGKPIKPLIFVPLKDQIQIHHSFASYVVYHLQLYQKQHITTTG